MRCLAARLPLLLLPALLVACAPDPERPGEPAAEPEIVDVGPPLDATIDLAEDRKGELPTEELGGVLPGDFPADFPLYVPASLTDFGRGYVVLVTPDPLASVREGQLGRLRRAGWEVGASGDGATAARSGRTVRLEFSSAGSGTEIRIVYR